MQTITANNMPPANTDSPDGNQKFFKNFTKTIKPINPNITEGIPAIISINPLIISLGLSFTYPDNKSALPTPMGKAIIIATSETYNVAKIILNIDRFLGSDNGFQVVPVINLSMGTSLKNI